MNDKLEFARQNKMNRRRNREHQGNVSAEGWYVQEPMIKEHGQMPEDTVP